MKNTFAGHGREYLDGPSRQVPGFASLHRVVEMLLAERMLPAGRLLVVGAGGGIELRALAYAQAGWTFDGVDPSADMLELAAETVGPHVDRVRLHHGGIEAAPEGPFDGTTCLLVFYFIDRAERERILAGLRQCLRPGAPLLLMHISFPQAEPERSHWIARHAAYGAPLGTDPAHLAAAREAIGTRLTVLSPEEDEAMLAEAGFERISLFFAGLSFRGWVCYAS